MNRFINKKNCIYVSRASTAIYLILKDCGIKKKKVLVPANVCYAAVYPILYSDNIPVFCDISDDYGNVSLDEIKKYDDISAAIIPHMYGNPIQKIKNISDYFNKEKILFIEDCASAMGATVDGVMVGNFGDYSIFSTGYSKTLDAGFGGIICSNRNLENINSLYNTLHPKNSQDDFNEEFFSKLYRLIRNSNNQSLSKYIWENLVYNVKDIFINYIPDVESKISPMLDNLNQVVRDRRSKYELYSSNIMERKEIKMLPLSTGASPWRFSLLLSPYDHRQMIDYLLCNEVPVSDWYPDVTPLFGFDRNFPNTKSMESRIVNFPLLIEDDLIKRYCQIINQYYLTESK